MMKSRLTVAVLLMGLMLGTWGCSTNPATGRSQFNIIGEGQEIELGTQAQPGFTKDYGGEIPSEPIRKYVSDLGHRLAAASERPSLPWTFTVLDSGVINAFALPGGKVFISRALLADMTNEAQLAGVLGHEIGHVTAQHMGQQMSQALVVQGVAVGLGVAGNAANKDYLRVLGVGAQAGGSVYLLKFGRDQESEADALGVRYMTHLGYNPMGQVQVMEILKKASGGGANLEILSTHPLPQTRIDRLNKLIDEEYPDHDSPGRYRFGEAEFKAAVIDNLSKLPAPKHSPKKQAGVWWDGRDAALLAHGVNLMGPGQRWASCHENCDGH